MVDLEALADDLFPVVVAPEALADAGIGFARVLACSAGSLIGALVASRVAPLLPAGSVLRSTAIYLTAKVTGSRVTANGTVIVKNGAGTAVRGASVTVTWTKPDLSTATQTATTGTSGNARFSTTGGRGTFTLTVNNATQSGYTFDRPAAS